MAIGILTLHFFLPGCQSLKEKRSRIKPILFRLHREFNLSVSEMGHQDTWQEAVLFCALICNDSGLIQQEIERVMHFTEAMWPDCNLLDHNLEIIH
jgi:uncharacterized protein